MAGKHAKQRGRHAAEQPSRWWKWTLLLLVIVGAGTVLPLLMALGLAFGIITGWLSRAITRT